MRTIDVLDVLYALISLRDSDEIDNDLRNKVRAEIVGLVRRFLDNGDPEDLETITLSAGILDRHAPEVGPGKLAWAARNLDEHRATVVSTCLKITGPRIRIDIPDEAPVSLSDHEDHRPGWGENAAKPSGLENPTPWEIRRANQAAALDGQLRDDPKRLHLHVRGHLNRIRPKHADNTPAVHERYWLQSHPEMSAVYHAYRRRGKTHAYAYRLVTETPRDIANRQLADDYARQYLGKEDTAPSGARVTVFELGDIEKTQAERRSASKCELCAHFMRHSATPPRATNGVRLCSECRSVGKRYASTPCVWCGIDRPHADHRGTAHRRGHATGHDDGLCRDCHDSQRPGLPPRFAEVDRYIRSRAYLHADDRPQLVADAHVHALCASVITYYGLSPAALHWLRCYHAVAAPAAQRIIREWGSRLATQPHPAPDGPVEALAAAA